MATRELNRRALLRATAATVALAAPVALAGSLIPVAVASPLPSLPAVPDPLIGLVAAMRKADRLWNLAIDRCDIAENAAWEAGFNVRHPFLTVGNYSCSSVGMVVNACQPNDERGPPAAEMPGHVREMRRLLAQKRRQRKAAGLAPLDAKVAAAKREYWRLSLLVATTPALTMAGLVAKLKLLKPDVDDDSLSLWAKPLMAGAFADAKRLAGGVS